MPKFIILQKILVDHPGIMEGHPERVQNHTGRAKDHTVVTYLASGLLSAVECVCKSFLLLKKPKWLEQICSHDNQTITIVHNILQHLRLVCDCQVVSERISVIFMNFG